MKRLHITLILLMVIGMPAAALLFFFFFFLAAAPSPLLPSLPISASPLARSPTGYRWARRRRITG
jgi:hypothetical protein